MRRAIAAVTLSVATGACHRPPPRLPCDEPDGPHDHSPHHGGIVGMSGDKHVELASAHTMISVWPSDRCRRPLPASGRGEVLYDLADGGTARDTLTADLQPEGAWRAPLPGDAVQATVTIPILGTLVEMTWSLERQDGGSGR
jgi:hypothetical protein